MRVKTLSLAAAVAVALALGACGDDDNDTPEQTGDASATTQEQQATVPPGLPASLAEVAPRLIAAGHEVTQVNATEFTSGAMALTDGPMKVQVYGHGTKGDTAKSAARLKHFQEATPEQVAIAVHDDRIYVGTVDAPAKIDEAKFNEIVATAEG